MFSESVTSSPPQSKISYLHLLIYQREPSHTQGPETTSAPQSSNHLSSLLATQFNLSANFFLKSKCECFRLCEAHSLCCNYQLCPCNTKIATHVAHKPGSAAVYLSKRQQTGFEVLRLEKQQSTLKLSSRCKCIPMLMYLCIAHSYIRWNIMYLYIF